MKRLLILTDEQSNFLVSIPDLKNYRSMDTDKLRSLFASKNYKVDVVRFSDLDMNEDYKGVYILYQSSESPGSFYKRYIENLIYFLEKQGARVMPKYEFLKAHHDKMFMELLRSTLRDSSLKSVTTSYFGSWVDAQNRDFSFPVVIKQISSAGSAGVSMAVNKEDFNRKSRNAGKIILARSLSEVFNEYFKNIAKKILRRIHPERSGYFNYDTTPLSTPIIVQNFVDGLKGDTKVLVFGNRFYTLYRKNRENDFRASGSGRFFEVPADELEGLLNFAQKLRNEIDFPILGIDIGFDGENYHLLEFQMVHLGPIGMQRSKCWYELHDGKWNRYEGTPDLEVEYSRSIDEYICNSDPSQANH
jgi:glutathione synthase/RimK-type ligase-like ATP-grasp enzyme